MNHLANLKKETIQLLKKSWTYKLIMYTLKDMKTTN